MTNAEGSQIFLDGQNRLSPHTPVESQSPVSFIHSFINVHGHLGRRCQNLAKAHISSKFWPNTHICSVFWQKHTPAINVGQNIHLQSGIHLCTY